jgi:predicted CXXCH cytochrome family protein
MISLAFLACPWNSATVSAAQQQQVPAVKKQTPPAKPAEFVGAETCALCHADLSKKFSSNPHSALALMHGGKGVTCESCHGSGEAHVASGGDPTKILQLSKMSAQQIDTTCLGCHASAHPNFLRSDHAKAGVGCESCHSIHGPITIAAAAAPAAAAPTATVSASAASHPAVTSTSTVDAVPAAAPARKPPFSTRIFGAFKADASSSDPLQQSSNTLPPMDENPNLLRASQPQLCFSCHSDVKPAFSQPFHHKVVEGLVKCTDCHDTHGTFGKNQLRSTADQNMVCTKCHTETRGPFVFEHAAVKAEGCLGCHSPHGSQNARLLNVPNINQMCNQCHSPVAAGTVHGINAGSAEVQSCVGCHTMIHGSNINPAFIR